MVPPPAAPFTPPLPPTPLPPTPPRRAAVHALRTPAQRLRLTAGSALLALVCAVAAGWWVSTHPGSRLQTLLARLPDLARTTAWLRQPDLTALPGLPRHWNPWAPLTLEEPDGPLTHWKLGRLEAAPAACLQWLAEAPGLASTPLPDRTTGTAGSAGSCGWQAASRISGMGEARFSSPFTLTCGAAVALARWERHVLQPAAQAQLGSPVVRIEHFGSYACRRIAGRSSGAGPGRLSEHASANALDVAGFTLADGQRISVLKDWGAATLPSSAATSTAASEDEGDASATSNSNSTTDRPAPAMHPKAVFLRQVHRGACRGFRAVLGPDYNAAHRNHFHLDRGVYRACR